MNITSEMAGNCPIRWDDYTKQERQRDSLGVGIKTGDRQMEATAPTAREQFVSDFTIITDNDREAYFETVDLVRAKKESVPAISDTMREGWENQIAKALDVLRQSGEVEAVTIDIMGQMLNNWGSDVFDDIARHYITKDSE